MADLVLPWIIPILIAAGAVMAVTEAALRRAGVTGRPVYPHSGAHLERLARQEMPAVEAWRRWCTADQEAFDAAQIAAAHRAETARMTPEDDRSR